MPEASSLDSSALKVGDTFSQRLVEDLKRTQIVQYAGASGDYNPLHTDEIFAARVADYPSVFAHGMLTMGMTGRLLTDNFGHENVLKFGVRFTEQVWPGDTLEARATVTAVWAKGKETLIDLDIETSNQDGVVVMRGQARVRAA